MDIDLLSKMIKELILDNDRVVLPGLGCFVAEVVPAAFSDKGYTINPPYRKLYFRSKPDVGNAIVDFYAESNSIDRELAARILGDFISDLKEIIYVKKVMIFPGLGRLRATKENNLFFIADENLDIYPAGVGLESVSLKSHSGLEAVEEEVEEEAVAEEMVTEEVEPVVDEGAEEEEAAVEVEEAKVEDAKAEEADEAMEEVMAEEEEVEETVMVEEEVTVEEVKVRTGAEVVRVPLWKKLLVAAGLFIAALLAMLVLYVAVARIFPNMIDSLLYSQEEMEIINR